MKQSLLILLSFFAQQTFCADKAATPAKKSDAHTPKHSPQQSISTQNPSESESNQSDTNGLSDKVKELLAQAGTLIFRSPAASADKKDETES